MDLGYRAVDADNHYYETVDACTRHGVALTITPEGVRRPVALGVLTLMLALAHKLLIKDRLTRAGRWAEKLDHTGTFAFFKPRPTNPAIPLLGSLSFAAASIISANVFGNATLFASNSSLL